MRRLGPMALAGLCLIAPFSALHASGDFACAPNWKLVNASYDECGSTAMLAPGNDTRVNLFYLLGEPPAAPGAAPGAAPRAALAYPADLDPAYGHSFFGWSLLRRTYYPAESSEPGDGYGSRCISLASGRDAFVAAMQANRGLPAAERDRLAQARGTIAAACSGKPAAPSLVAPQVRSAPGRDYLAYLQAADAFYAEQWDAARGLFAGLRASRDPWLAETAAYMLARSELNAAQAGAFDEYGSFAAGKVDKDALARASAGFADYLKRYAAGRYAGSAAGLVRRTLWLSGDAAGLARAYERLLGTAATGAIGAPGVADLVQEIDSKLLFVADAPSAGAKLADGPLLLATVDLMMMRDPVEGEARPVISAEAIAAQAPRFTGRADLYGFVVASHAFYVEKDMAKVLRLIPDDAKRPSYAPLAFSRQMLRGMALTAARDRNQAGFWRDLVNGAQGLYQRPLVELALAMTYERAGRLGEVFAPASPIGETLIREILLEQVAGPDLLRAQAANARRPRHERDVALFTLLRKELGYGDYAGFLRDEALVGAGAKAEGGVGDVKLEDQVPVGLFRAGTWSDSYACPALPATAAALARDPRDVKARLCLGDFYRLNGFDDQTPDGERPKPDELGGTPPLFPGKAAPRGAIYADVIADPGAAPGDKAYALYRAINCYGPSGINQCGNADVPKERRRAWFQQLKHDHAESPWAQKLRYYW